MAARMQVHWVATWSFRWLLVRVILGMGKLKFATGWARHPLFLKWYMASGTL